MKYKLIITIISTLILNVAIAAALQPILELNIGMLKDDTILFESAKITFGAESSIMHEEGDYKIIITDIEGETLFKAIYNLQFVLYADPPVFVEYSFINEKIKYEPEMYKLEVYHKEKAVYDKFLDFCNKNGECEAEENFISCPNDCSLNEKDNICIKAEDAICDPDCIKGADLDCKKKISKTTITTIILILLAAIAIAVLEWKKKIISKVIEKFK